MFSNDSLFDNLSVLHKDFIVDHAFLGSNIEVGTFEKTKKRQRKSSKPVLNEVNKVVHEETNECKMRKIMHRDIERQRRKEMTGLYASIRSLLPLDYVKGKRSITEHMHGATNYIKCMETNIKELKLRRDKLKSLSNQYSAGLIRSSNNINSNVQIPISVMVNSCHNSTVEILISCGLKDEAAHVFPLSKVMTILLNTGLDVLSCVSTKTNETFIHRIQSEASDHIDLPQLQKRLVTMIK